MKNIFMSEFAISQCFHEFPHNYLTDVNISKYSVKFFYISDVEKDFLRGIFVTKITNIYSFLFTQ